MLITGISVFRVKDAQTPMKGNILRKTHLAVQQRLDHLLHLWSSHPSWSIHSFWSVLLSSVVRDIHDTARMEPGNNITPTTMTPTQAIWALLLLLPLNMKFLVWPVDGCNKWKPIASFLKAKTSRTQQKCLKWRFQLKTSRYLMSQGKWKDRPRDLLCQEIQTMLQTQGMVVAVEDVKMRIGNKHSNVKTMTISSYQNGNNHLSIDLGPQLTLPKHHPRSRKRVTFVQSNPPILLLPKMSEIPALKPFLNHLLRRHGPVLLLQNRHTQLLTMKTL